jgi:threonine/homoserine/homoserine lactone efflux protein
MTYLLSGILFGLSAGWTPGPLFMLVISETLKHGFKEGIKVAIAPLLTDLPIIIAALFLLSRLSNVEVVFGVISFLGGLFLIYLGYESLRFKGVEMDTIESRPQSLKKGIIANVLNPAPYLFWLTIGGPIILKAVRIHILWVVCFVLSLYLVFISSKIGIAFAVGKSRVFLKSRGYIYAIRTLGMVLLLYSIRFLISGLQYLHII